MISGGMAGGSTAMEVAITAVAVIDLIFAIIIYYAFYLLTVYTIVDTLLPYYMYMQSGDIQYANSLLIDFVINLTTLETGKLLREAIERDMPQMNK